MNNKFVVFDIDGCCIDCSERLKFLMLGNLQLFNKLWKTDKAIEAGVEVYSALMRAGFRAVFITARWSATAKSYTKIQLEQLFPSSEFDYEVIMAPKHQTDHAAYKINSLRNYLQSKSASMKDVLVCFDDNLDVVERYRSEGLMAYLTAEGWRK